MPLDENNLQNNNNQTQNKQHKTAEYTLRASKKYRERNPDKIKAYRDKYKADKAEIELATLPNDKLSKSTLLYKIKNLEDKIAQLELINKNLLEKQQ